MASTDALVHAGYLRYRIPLLQEGTELYEVKPWPSERIPREPDQIGNSGAFALHAKVFVIDRQRVFVGSVFRSALAQHQYRNRPHHRQPANRPRDRYTVQVLLCLPTAINWCWSRMTAGAPWCDGQARKGEIGALHHRARRRRRQARGSALSLMPIGRSLAVFDRSVAWRSVRCAVRQCGSGASSNLTALDLKKVLVAWRETLTQRP
jgi:hypothetical protein